MNSILTEIFERASAVVDCPDYLDAVFGAQRTRAETGCPVVIVGAGNLGLEMLSALRRQGLSPVSFCDSDVRKAGTTLNGLPVVSLDDLRRDHLHSLIVPAVARHRADIRRKLVDLGFADDHVLCPDQSTADFVYMYSMVGTQGLFDDYGRLCHPESYRQFLLRHGQRVADAHRLLADGASKRLLIDKLALMASEGHFKLFCDFIREHSNPLKDFGFGGYEGTPEDHYYFNNDVLSLIDGEIYVDVGAYDGDTVATFVDASRRQGVDYGRIIAFEPDPACYRRLAASVADVRAVSCHPLGLWSTTTTLKFASSATAIHDQAAVISESGDLTIEATSLDDFLRGQPVTLIKMDPGGNIIPQVLQGAAGTIRRHRPKLALGAYHGPSSIFDIPLQVHGLDANYRLFLRHNTFHLCDTALFAVS